MTAAVTPMEQARATAATIEGWLTDAEGEFLFRLAAACPPGLPVVEIGSWKGKSTVWLASGVRSSAGTLVFAIDPHEQSLEDPSATTLDELKGHEEPKRDRRPFGAEHGVIRDRQTWLDRNVQFGGRTALPHFVDIDRNG